MKTGITDAKCNEPFVLYDGDCSLCTGSARRFEPVLRIAGFKLATLQSRNAGLSEMRVLLPDGRAFGGADGVVQISRRVWWAWPLFAFAQIPGVMPLLRVGYRRVAMNRHCFSSSCQMKPKTRRHGVTTFIEMP